MEDFRFLYHTAQDEYIIARSRRDILAKTLKRGEAVYPYSDSGDQNAIVQYNLILRSQFSMYGRLEGLYLAKMTLLSDLETTVSEDASVSREVYPLVLCHADRLRKDLKGLNREIYTVLAQRDNWERKIYDIVNESKATERTLLDMSLDFEKYVSRVYANIERDARMP